MKIWIFLRLWTKRIVIHRLPPLLCLGRCCAWKAARAAAVGVQRAFADCRRPICNSERTVLMPTLLREARPLLGAGFVWAPVAPTKKFSGGGLLRTAVVVGNFYGWFAYGLSPTDARIVWYLGGTIWSTLPRSGPVPAFSSAGLGFQTIGREARATARTRSKWNICLLNALAACLCVFN